MEFLQATAAMTGGAPTASFFATGSVATATVGISAAAPLSIRVYERESTTKADPSADAVLQAVGADAAAIAAAAASWWRDFWGRSSVSLPGQPGLEALWNGAAYALAATSSVDPSVPPPGLYGVWATSDGCNWNGAACGVCGCARACAHLAAAFSLAHYMLASLLAPLSLAAQATTHWIT